MKAEEENLIRRKISILRSDNGGECSFKHIGDFCKGEGIKRE